LELVWLRDSVDLFFLQVQGSGRIRFPDASMIRLGYAGKNGREYSSLGQTLIARGIFTAQNVSADAIRDWLRANPKEGREEMWTNESYVFFRELTDVPSEKGPLGAMGRSITAGRSIAVDPAFVELGAPVWIEKDGPNPIKRLMIAQDTGSAIKGAQRADVFFGTGEGAGHAASAVNDGGRMVTLLPIALAEQLTKGKS
jgi:membrane-bound lytic murein transglycosylase A